MSLELQDARTSQPVSLGKQEFSQIFLNITLSFAFRDHMPPCDNYDGEKSSRKGQAPTAACRTSFACSSNQR